MNRLAWLAQYSGSPWIPENEYSQRAEAFMESSWNEFIWPFISDCGFRSVIDLAAGHGRNSTKLQAVADRILILDISQETLRSAALGSSTIRVSRCCRITATTCSLPPTVPRPWCTVRRHGPF